MNQKDLLKEMKDSVGTKDPVVFFEKMVSVFEVMFEKLDGLEKDVKRVKTNSALAIQWEPKVPLICLLSRLIFFDMIKILIMQRYLL
jgi:hypothetical protein